MKTIPLTRGYVAIVDDEDYDSLARYSWQVRIDRNKIPYATRKTGKDPRRTDVHMHRVIAGTPPGMLTDHKNGDTLDNRRHNLRAVTYRQNAQNRKPGQRNNTTGYKGVSRDHGRYRATIKAEGRMRFLGNFDTAEEAAERYNAAAIDLFGEFAQLNVIR